MLPLRKRRLVRVRARWPAAHEHVVRPHQRGSAYVKVTMRASLRGLCLVAAFLGGSLENGLAQDPNRSTTPQVTNLAGARDQPGLFTQRLRMPANFCSPVHVHNHDLHGLVLRGILWMGFPDSTGEFHVREYPPGSFVPVPAGQRHVEGSAVETEIHLSGIGPLRTTVVDSSPPLRCLPGMGTSPGTP
jgi:hypothetical protein